MTKIELISKGTLFSKIIICLMLSAIIFALYWQVIGFEFITFDDPNYVVKNYIIKQGITADALRWAFTSTYIANWHPLTWISYMLDVNLFGINPGSHHLVNVILHVLNTLLLFIILDRMTAMTWRSVAVAALFALHPMHVESVAWISERKDVLSTFFFMITIIAYWAYVNHRNFQRYITIVFFYILGLMSKPMLVTLPFILLLLDIWPINRIDLTATDDSENLLDNIKVYLGQFSSLFFEKVPLMLLALISCGITIYAQKSWRAVGSLENLPIGLRLLNAVTSYVSYLMKMVWPHNLAIFYPYPKSFNPLIVISSIVAFLLITLLVLLFAKKLPYLITGWFWYLGTLIPVIGIVQVGSQSMADRYTYIPFIGLFIIIVWGFVDLSKKMRYGKIILGIVSIIVSILIMKLTWEQVGFWKNSETLFSHTIQVTKNNAIAHNNIGLALYDKGNLDGAILEFQKALSINENFESYNGLGVCYTLKNDLNSSIEYYSKGLKFDPNNININMNLGIIMTTTRRPVEAIPYFQLILGVDPYNIKAHFNLGKALLQSGNIDKAIYQFNETLRIDPSQVEARNNLEEAIHLKENNNELITKINELILRDPRNPDLYTRVGDIYLKQCDYDKAINNYKKAILIQPNYTQAMKRLAFIYSVNQETTKALDILHEIIEYQPNDPDSYYNIACLYAKQNKVEESLNWLKQAIKKGFNNWDLIQKDPDLSNIRNTSYVNELMKTH